MKRRVMAAGTAALLLVGLAAGAPAEADNGKADPALRTALAAAPETLRTPFEVSNGRSWTTFDESVRFWRQLDAGSDRVRVQTVGRTKQERPLQLVSVGAPAPRTVSEAAQGSVAMYVCSVHGNENSGREACMQLARDLSSTTDAALTRFLERTTVLFLNANPDGWVANTRGNSDGIDVNRDYLGLETNEAKAVTRVIRDWKPDVLNDLHEYGPSEFYRTDLLHLWPRNRNVDGAVHDLAQEMSQEYSAAQATASGYTEGIYGQWVKNGEPFLQVAGDGQGRILRNYAGLVNVAGMLSEAANRPLNDAEQADASLLNRRRVAVNYASAVGSVQMVLENRDVLARETAASAERNTVAGRDQTGVIYFGGQDDMLPTERAQVEPKPMCAYQLTAAAYTEIRPTLALHGIRATRSGDGYRVSMAQPTRGLIPLLLDDRSEYKITTGTPLASC